MGDLVNLRIMQKRAGRQRAERQAAANRLLLGRSKAERDLETARSAKARGELDRNRIETGGER